MDTYGGQTEEFTVGQEKFPRLKQHARRSIDHGENLDGNWTSEQFLEQLKHCAPITERNKASRYKSLARTKGCGHVLCKHVLVL